MMQLHKRHPGHGLKPHFDLGGHRISFAMFLALHRFGAIRVLLNQVQRKLVEELPETIHGDPLKVANLEVFFGKSPLPGDGYFAYPDRQEGCEWFGTISGLWVSDDDLRAAQNQLGSASGAAEPTI